MSDSEVKISFKPIKKKNLRQRKQSSDEETSDKQKAVEIDSDSVINETKERQKLRNRVNGVNA